MARGRRQVKTTGRPTTDVVRRLVVTERTVTELARRVQRLAFAQGTTMDEIAASIGLSRQNLSQRLRTPRIDGRLFDRLALALGKAPEDPWWSQPLTKEYTREDGSHLWLAQAIEKAEKFKKTT